MEQEIIIRRDVAFATKSNRELQLDLYLPQDATGTETAVLLIHGGAWRKGSREMMSPYGRELARHGFVAIAPEYRLLGEAPWPAQLADVKTALRWTRENTASLGILSDRVALQGFSAGGHLALMAGGTADQNIYRSEGSDPVHSDRPDAVISLFPPVELALKVTLPDIVPASNLLGEKASLEGARQASPIHLVSGSFPPTFLLHGTADTLVPASASRRMFDALAEKRVKAELHLYPDHTHEFAALPSMLKTVQAEIRLFLQRMVVAPETHQRENLKLNKFARMP